MSLTAKQERFVAEYLIDLNATQAAIRAGYSEKGANVQGSKLLANANIQAAIQEAQAKRSIRTKITQDRVLQELARIGFADIRKAVSWGRSPVDTQAEEAEPNGLGIYPVELMPSSEIDDDTAAAISEVCLTAQGVKLKTHDKLAALDKIARHLGMLNGSGAGDDEAPSLTININSKDPVGDVRVTRSNG
ncbi:terminase small subunit [Pseudophaeobacter arcticus]|uniref:Terminase small subunit n=1 Tax=Pseudophaeobacter arcticus TaxID=385492 RepID=A0ABQ0ALC9_9RHOB